MELLKNLTSVSNATTGRVSSWDRSGRNDDSWKIGPGKTSVLADIKGPGCITHIWMTQQNHYRECLIRITWDNARHPSILVPLGDFFCLGHGIVNSFQSLLFSASTNWNNQFNRGCALNCYVQMPFKERAFIELINQGKEDHIQYFYIDYETYDKPPENSCYFHCEFRRANPFGGWGHEITPNHRLSDISNKGRLAYENNYIILETEGCGHYIGCNLSITNFRSQWWGEGDDMIWVDGYRWPPDLHGTGSEDYFNQAWGMQGNAFMHNGSSIYEGNTIKHMDAGSSPWDSGGYQTSYVFHIENSVRFKKDIKVTIEHGHGNHLANDVASVAYWYAVKPARAAEPPVVSRRMPILRDNQGKWLYDKKNQCPGKSVKLNSEMKKMKRLWKKWTSG